MSACKFFRNFLLSPQTISKDNSCHQTIEKELQTYDMEMQKTQESCSSRRNAEKEEELEMLHVGRDRQNVGISTESKSEKIDDVSIQIRPERVAISDDECVSIASSSNTEIYEESDCQDVAIEEETHEDNGIHEEETKEAIIKRNVVNLAALADVRSQFPSQMKSNQTNQEHVLLLGVTTESNRSTNNAFSLLSFILNSTLQRSSDNLCSIVLPKSNLAIPGESHVLNTMLAKSNQIESKDSLSNVMNKEQPSSTAGILYEDEVLTPTVLFPSTITQALLPSNQANCRVESNLYNHELELPKVRSFNCNFGNKSFTTKSDFVYHKKLHEKVELIKSFVCNICKQAFRFSLLLKQHMIIHEKSMESSSNEQIQLKMGLLKHLRSSNDEHVGGISRSDKFCNEDTSECEVSRFKNTTEAIPRQCYTKDRLLKPLIGKRVAAGVSSLESQSPSMTQTLLSSDHSDAAKDDSVSCSRQANNDSRASSTFCSQKDSKETLQFPPGSTLVGSRGVYCMKDKEKPFGCGYCGKVYERRRAAYSHISQRHKEKSYQHSCEICGKHFSLSSYLAQHVRIHTQEKPFTCDDCGKQFRFRSSLHTHKFTHSEERLFHCSICSKSFKTKDALSKHQKSHKNENRRKGISCNICKMKFRIPSRLKQHMIIHEKPIESSSHEQIQLKMGLLKHLLSSNDGHVGGISRSDKFCNEDTSECKLSRFKNTTETLGIQGHTKDRLSKPLIGKRISVGDGASSLESQSPSVTETLLSSDHSDAAKEVLVSCSRQANNDSRASSTFCKQKDYMVTLKFPPGSTLVGHRGVYRMKDKEKPFGCGYCGKAYERRRAAYSHISQRHEEKRFQYSCEICGRHFSLSSYLAQHVRIHTQERPFTCGECGKQFRFHSSLHNHKFTHSEERLFHCSICSKSFKTKDALSKHQKSHKNEDRRKSISCNICKMKFRIPSRWKQHMIIHEKSIESSSNEQIQLKMGLLKHLRSSNDEHVGGISRSDKFCNEDTSECEVSRFKNNTERLGIQCHTKDCLSKFLIVKRVSVAAGVVYDDKVSSLESQSSDHSDAAKDVSVSCSRQANNDSRASSTFCSQKDSKETLQFPPGSTLVGHRGVYRMKDNEKPFGCGYCGKVYERRRAAYSHIRQQHEKKSLQYSCEFCGKHFSVPSYLAQHIRIHAQEKPFTCDECGKQFSFKSSLHSHKRTHSNKRPYTCNKCNKSFKFSDNLSRHAESHKKEDERKGVSCNVCKRKLAKPSLLKEHMMIHTGEKPFKCTLCEKQYRLKVELRNHMNTHCGKKLHADKTCSVCGKTFGVNYISLHMRVHSGEKPFGCNICGKRFPRKAYLEGHIRSHTGEKPFACSGCDNRFALYSNMVTHKAKCTTLSVNVS